LREERFLQVLFFSVLFAFGMLRLGKRGKLLIDVIEVTSQGLFSAINLIMKVAPIGAFGAMAFTIGKYGIVTLVSLIKLLAAFYGSCLIFVLGVLSLVAYFAGFSLWKFLRSKNNCSLYTAHHHRNPRFHALWRNSRRSGARNRWSALSCPRATPSISTAPASCLRQWLCSSPRQQTPI
jgi:hypothetical protein